MDNADINERSELKMTNIRSSFYRVFLIVVTSSLLMYWIFDFEIVIIFLISLSIAFIASGFVGLENILIKLKK